MKLVFTIAHDRDKNRIAKALLHSRFEFTQIGSTGGFLQEGNVTLLIGVDDEEVERLLTVLGGCCQIREQFVNVMPSAAMPVGTPPPAPIKVQIGGAVCFVIKVERFQRL